MVPLAAVFVPCVIGLAAATLGFLLGAVDAEEVSGNSAKVVAGFDGYARRQRATFPQAPANLPKTGCRDSISVP